MPARPALSDLFGSAKQRRAASHLVVLAVLLLGVMLPATRINTSRNPTLPQQPEQPASKPDMGRMPLSFEPNMGQSDPAARFIAHAPGGAFYFTPSEVVLSLKSSSGPEHIEIGSNSDPAPSAVRVQFVGADQGVQIERGPSLPGKVNYFLGNDPAKWHTDIPTYSGIEYSGLYPGVDLGYGSVGGQLKGTYTVAPGVDPSVISWRYTEASGVRVDEAGNLLITLPNSQSDNAVPTLIEQVPVAWQEIDGQRVMVQAAYAVGQNGSVGFSLGDYDRSHPLTIDPTLVLPYSTYLGGNGDDRGYGIVVDGSGNAYVTGNTRSTNFPTLNQYQPNLYGNMDAFVTKINTTQVGNPSLIYSTYLGGTEYDYGQGIAVDSSGNAYVAGYTNSIDFPTVNEYQTHQYGTDAIVSKLSASGSSLLYSTYLAGTDIGGATTDEAYGIGVGNSGVAYVTGFTESNYFPTLNEYQGDQGLDDVFVTKLDTTLSGNASLLYSTYLGGSGQDDAYGIAVGNAGNIYVTGVTTSTNYPILNWAQINQPGDDAFVTRINTTLSGNASLLYSTYLGGSGDETGYSISLGGAGNVYITGNTASTDFPRVNQYQNDPALGDDAFVTRVDTTLSGYSSIIYSTYLGGDFGDYGRGIYADSSGNAYVTGYTASINFPTRGELQTNQSAVDTFVTKINTGLSGDPSLVYSTYLAGSDQDYAYGIAADASGDAYVTGYTYSTDFPLNNQYQTDQPVIDLFVSRLSFTNATPTPTFTRTPTRTPTPQAATATQTPVAPSATATPSNTAIPPTFTRTPTRTSTVPPTQTIGGPSATPISTNTSIPTSTRTPTPAPTNTAIPTSTPTRTSTIPPSNTPTRTATVAPTQTPGGPSATPIPTNTNTLTPTRTPTRTSTSTIAPTGTTAPSNTPTRTLTPLPTQTPGGPTATSVPSNTPMPTSTTAPTDTPGVPTPTACPIQFTDVQPDNTFYPFVRCMACRGIINGYPCGGASEPCNPNNDPYFRPSNPVTRGQLSKIVSNSAGFADPPTGQTFEDVPSGSTFYMFIERLASRGVMSGYACGGPNEPCGPANLPYFRPGSGATRGQLTKIVSNAAGFTDPAPSAYTFTDVPVGSTFHIYVERLLLNRPGVMGGYACGGSGESCDAQNRPYFRPANPLSRGQTSKIVGNTFYPNCQTPAR